MTPLTHDELMTIRAASACLEPALGVFRNFEIENIFASEWDEDKGGMVDASVDVTNAIDLIVDAAEWVPALLAEVDRLRTRYETAVRDHCDEDTALRDIARPVLGDAAVDGDSDARPTAVDVVQMMVDRLRCLLTGVVVQHSRIVTENEVGNTISASECYIGTNRDVQGAS